MQRGRAYRRYREVLAKKRARRTVIRWGADPTPKIVGRAAAVHCKFCSNSGCCGNLRASVGLTRPERAFLLKAQETIKLSVHGE